LRATYFIGATIGTCSVASFVAIMVRIAWQSLARASLRKHAAEAR
jgi:hypothetical protein